MIVKVVRAVEENKIRNQNLRTYALGLPSNLTYEQWTETLEYFNYSCAYCGSSYQVIEHFVPVEHGGGTFQANCIPSCIADNLRKGALYPIEHIFSNDVLVNIQTYIASLPVIPLPDKPICNEVMYSLKVVAHYLQVSHTVLLQLTFDGRIDGIYYRQGWRYSERAVRQFEETYKSTHCVKCGCLTHDRFSQKTGRFLCSSCAGIQQIGDRRKLVAKKRDSGKQVIYWSDKKKTAGIAYDVILQEGQRLLEKKELVSIHFMIDRGTLWRVVELVGDNQVIVTKASQSEWDVMREYIHESSCERVEDVYREDGERLVIELFKQGKTNKAIANELEVSLLSVNAMLAHLKRKANVRTSQALRAYLNDVSYEELPKRAYHHTLRKYQRKK